jgi:hypothetical protein
MRSQKARGVAALFILPAVLLAACSSATGPSADPVPVTAIAPTAAPVTPSPSPLPTAPISLGTPLYLVDANTSNALGTSIPVGLLSGVKGAIPGADIPEAFKADLLTEDADLSNFAYAAEAYDAVILAALAAASAASDTGTAMASRLQPITNGSDRCYDYAECLALVVAGREIDYNGRSGVVDFSASGDPTREKLPRSGPWSSVRSGTNPRKDAPSHRRSKLRRRRPFPLSTGYRRVRSLAFTTSSTSSRMI